MADIFLSYAREDLARAEPLVKAMEAEGWTVFWDPSIVPGAEYRPVIDRELDAARCVVVLWSRSSIASAWVRDEADAANARGVLFSVLIEDVKPPTGLRQVQSADLASWNGQPNAPAVKPLVRAIAQRIGGRAEVRLLPVDLNLITGDKSEYRDLVPTVNMMCTLDNSAEESVELRRLELIALQQGEPVYHLAWHLFYDERNLGEHVKVTAEQRIIVPGKSTWTKGVQFRESRADISSVWPAGQYEFELLGWANRRPMQSVANVRTTFRGEVDAWIESQMRRWEDASREEWTTAGASDRAYGFSVSRKDIKTGV